MTFSFSPSSSSLIYFSRSRRWFGWVPPDFGYSRSWFFSASGRRRGFRRVREAHGRGSPRAQLGMHPLCPGTIRKRTLPIASSSSLSVEHLPDEARCQCRERFGPHAEHRQYAPSWSSIRSACAEYDWDVTWSEPMGSCDHALPAELCRVGLMPNGDGSGWEVLIIRSEPGRSSSRCNSTAALAVRVASRATDSCHRHE